MQLEESVLRLEERFSVLEARGHTIIAEAEAAAAKKAEVAAEQTPGMRFILENSLQQWQRQGQPR